MDSHAFILTPIVRIGRTFGSDERKVALAKSVTLISTMSGNFRSQRTSRLQEEQGITRNALNHVSSAFSTIPVATGPPPNFSGVPKDCHSSANSLLDFRNYVHYILIPLLYTASIPLPSFADVNEATIAAAVDDGSDFISDSVKENSPLTHVLGTVVLVLIVYATVGVIILTINNFITNQNDKRERAEIMRILEANPGLKVLSEAKKGAPPKTGSKSNVASGTGNRQQRRLEAKAKEREEREQKRREKKVAARNSASEESDKS